MPRPKSAQPSYLHHKPTNQAYCRIPDGTGVRRVVYLGRFNSPESKLEHARILAELAVGGRPPRPAGFRPRHPDLTVSEVALAFWDHAERYYRRPDGTTTNELVEYRYTLRALTDTHGGTPAREFGPLALKAVRQRMVDRRWKRTTVNNRVRRIKHVFKWAVENELVPPAVHQALAAVAGLPKGRGYAPEPDPVGPVSDEHVEATLPFVPAVVRAMIRVQRLTGMRPGEVVGLRPAEVDASGPVWVYRPRHHKTAHKGRERAVAIGPRAQAVLAKFAPADPTEFYFSPRRAMAEARVARAGARVTPRYPSHMRRNAAKRAAAPARPPAAQYTRASYARAIARGVVAANRARRREAERTGTAFAPIPHWRPNQLRHAHATAVRERFGLEAAQVSLGHAHAAVTEVYAEKNTALAVAVAAALG